MNEAPGKSETRNFRISAILHFMKANITITSRGMNTLQVEMYTAERVREFDLAEQELAAYLDTKTAAAKRARPKRKPAR